jgi:hypothetical protein
MISFFQGRIITVLLKRSIVRPFRHQGMLTSNIKVCSHRTPVPDYRIVNSFYNRSGFVVCFTGML